MLALSNLATGFASAILAKDTASEGGSLIDIKTRNAVSTSQALKMYTIGEGGSENKRRLRKLQAGEIENVPVDQALEMLLKCYEGTEIVTVQYDEGPGQKVTKIICGPEYCATSSFTFQDSGGKPCSNLLTDTACVPVAGELCTVSFQKSREGYYTITMPAEGSGGGFVASSGGGFAASSGGGSFGGIRIPSPPLIS